MSTTSKTSVARHWPQIGGRQSQLQFGTRARGRTGDCSGSGDIRTGGAVRRAEGALAVCKLVYLSLPTQRFEPSLLVVRLCSVASSSLAAAVESPTQLLCAPTIQREAVQEFSVLEKNRPSGSPDSSGSNSGGGTERKAQSCAPLGSSNSAAVKLARSLAVCASEASENWINGFAMCSALRNASVCAPEHLCAARFAPMAR